MHFNDIYRTSEKNDDAHSSYGRGNASFFLVTQATRARLDKN